MRLLASRLTLLVATTSLLLSSGCGGTERADEVRATVSGTVTYNGKPLPAGTIVFASAGGNIASTISIGEGGRYSTDRAPIGANLVSIDTSSIQYGNPAKYVPIPEKYADPTASGLTADVKRGDNENVDFALQK